MMSIASPAKIAFTTLMSFDDSNGENPSNTSLVQGLDGNFYGTTYEGGANSDGTIFKITRSGVLTTLYNFCSQTGCTDGANPEGALVQGTDGNLYGVTELGGASSNCAPGGCGTVFKITRAGTLTTLHSFDDTDGGSPSAGLLQAPNGNFYGTTFGGGANGHGTVFKITRAGTLTTLHSFDNNDGDAPSAALVQAANGNFYGTTFGGGASGYGTVFKITPSGTLSTLHSFDNTDGAYPIGGMVQASDRNFYGTTQEGGVNSDGTVFKITSSGTLTTLHSFDYTDGAWPLAGLARATNGKFYGTTFVGGANSYGTVFEITARGTLTTLHSFDYTDGADPYALLLQATNGKFYGTTEFGGADGDGTVFSLSVGLGRFVKTNPTSGKVGTKVVILGNSLVGTTSVAFNGTEAEFKVASDTEIKTSVPTGATTGYITVAAPKGNLKSNVVFQVVQ